jgi:O-antigen ligase
VLQRVEFLHAASFIIRQHPLFGVGTGDVAHAFSEAYDALGSSLDQKHRLRAHNQYLTLWISTGILGLIALLFWLYQIFSAASWMPNARAALCIIVTLSFLTEDTLETTAGVVFVSFFAAFFADTLSPNTASLPQQE